MIHLDFETRCALPLPAVGLHRYAAAAQVLCLAYAIDDGPVELWTPGRPFPQTLAARIRDGADCCAHNAEFERAIFRACLPKYAPQDHQWVCTAVQASASGLPRGLDDAAKALRLPVRKAAAGRELISACCIPPYDDTRLPELYDYCRQDVEVERTLYGVLRPLSDSERDDLAVNMIINDVGLPIDHEFAAAAVDYAEEERRYLAERLAEVTGGELTKTSGVTLTRWVYDRLTPDQRVPMIQDDKVTLDRRTRADLLDDDTLPPLVRQVLQLSDDASNSSVGKYAALVRRSTPSDPRVRGAYMLNGAPGTGRYSSTGAQLHNFPRKAPPDADAIADMIVAGEGVPDAMATLSQMLRPTICAPEGDILIWADWSAIEGRVLPWLAEDDSKLAIFRAGKDPYKVNASGIFSVPYDAVTDDQRQAGKVAELALGFGGAVGALNAMGANYGLTWDEAEGRAIVNAWRRVNSWAPPFWDALEAAAMSAILHPGERHTAGRLTYVYAGRYLRGALLCELPSGRVLTYPEARIESQVTRWGPRDSIVALKGGRKPRVAEPWPRQRLWRGLLAENVTQAVAADLLREALATLVLDLDAPVIGHTHDEVLLEVPDTDEAIAAHTAALRQVMETPPRWAVGLPLKADTGVGYRYGK